MLYVYLIGLNFVCHWQHFYPLVKEFFLAYNTVPTRRNLTGNAWQNVFCSHSTRVLVPVLYPFGICSVPVPYPFSIRSILFCSCSVSVPSVSVLGTRSEERGFRELVYRNASKGLATLGLNFRFMCACMNANNKRTFMWWKCEYSYLKNTGRGLLCNFKASYGIFWTPKWYKGIGSLWLPEEKKYKWAGHALSTPSMKKCKQKTTFRCCR